MDGVRGIRGRRAVALIACVLSATAIACSDPASPSDEDGTSTDAHDHSHDLGETGDNFSFALGKPADEAAATRTVKVEAKEGFEFVPSGVAVKSGETITFEVSNSDKIDHEFVLGNKPYQELHESQVKAGGVYHNYSDYSVHVQPGESLSVTWTFERAGRILFACHVEGHYDAGMIGKITIS